MKNVKNIYIIKNVLKILIYGNFLMNENLRFSVIKFIM